MAAVTDDLVHAFNSTLTTEKSKFHSLYKARVGAKNSQEERREQLLKSQREKRQTLLESNRNVEEELSIKRKHPALNWKNEERFIEKKENKSLQWHQAYNHTLMMSEWMMEVPSNFNNWIMVPCPQGKRTLVVVKPHFATAFSKYGISLFTFQTLLPRRTYLDCIYNEKTKTFYVLDVIQWNGMCVSGCQTDFRFYWLSNQFNENPGLSEINDHNEYACSLLGHYNCDETSLTDAFKQYPMFVDDMPNLDGLLFYHSETHYTPGVTPLVGWLKGFMVPEVLNISTADEYLKEKPLGYKSLHDFVEKSNEAEKKKLPFKSKKWKNKLAKMDNDETKSESAGREEAHKEEETTENTMEDSFKQEVEKM